MPSEYNPQLVDNMSAKFRRLNNPAHAMADAIGMLQMFPGIRGIWTGGAIGASGGLRELINDLHLTNNNNPLFGYNTNTLISRVQYNGTNQYHSRASEAAFNITGTESYVATAQRGLTIGAWVRFDNNATATEMIASKWQGGANLSYALHRLSTGVLRFAISNDGSTQVNADTSATMTSGNPYFVCGRFTPSTSLGARINGTNVPNTTSIPASVFSGSSDFCIAANGTGANYLDGSVLLTFLCAAAVPDIFIDTYFQMTAPLFGVTV